MSPKAFLSILFLLVISVSHARAQDQRYVLLGGGLNLSEFYRTLDANYGYLPPQSFRTGFGAQAGYQSSSGDVGETVFTLGYETRGAVWTGYDGNDNKVDVTIAFSYLQAFLGSKFLMPLSPTASLYLLPGLALGLLLSQEASAGGQSADVDGVGPFDLDLSVAAGAQIPVGNNAIYFEGGYCFGVVDAAPDADHFSARNVNLKFRAGYMLGL
jgi:hypothetical protein